MGGRRGRLAGPRPGPPGAEPRSTWSRSSDSDETSGGDSSPASSSGSSSGQLPSSDRNSRRRANLEHVDDERLAAGSGKAGRQAPAEGTGQHAAGHQRRQREIDLGRGVDPDSLSAADWETLEAVDREPADPGGACWPAETNLLVKLRRGRRGGCSSPNSGARRRRMQSRRICPPVCRPSAPSAALPSGRSSRTPLVASATAPPGRASSPLPGGLTSDPDATISLGVFDLIGVMAGCGARSPALH